MCCFLFFLLVRFQFASLNWNWLCSIVFYLDMEGSMWQMKKKLFVCFVILFVGLPFFNIIIIIATYFDINILEKKCSHHRINLWHINRSICRRRQLSKWREYLESNKLIDIERQSLDSQAISNRSQNKVAFTMVDTWNYFYRYY